MLASCSLLKGQILSMVAHCMFCIRGKTQNHSADSLETLVENLVKTWECQVGLEKRLDWSFPKQCQFATYICVFVLLLNK